MHSGERSGQVPGPQGDAGHSPGRKDSLAHRTRSSKDSTAARTRSSRSERDIGSATSRKESQERQEATFRKWEEFKAFQREEKSALLEQKVELQRELIRAYDDLFIRRRADTDRKLSEVRKSELQKRRETEEALVQIGKDELGREKEEQITRRAQERAAERKRQKEKQNGEVDREEAAGDDRGGALRAAGHEGGIARAESGGLPPVGDMVFQSHDATGTLEEEGEEDAIQEEVLFEDLPPHKQKLYALLGEEEAEYFLHPRIEPERKKAVKVPHAVGKLGERVCADDLWISLRDRSQHRLQNADAQIPLELKDAYGAFVRECLTKNKTVAKRSFYSETEVPDNEKLQDSSYKQRVKETQRRMELMYRAALTNEDKTGVLLYNNPIPDFNNLEGREGPLRYIPSWIQQEEGDEQEEEEEQEMRGPSYKKWLPSSSNMELQPLQFDDNVDSYDIDMVQDSNMQQANDVDLDVDGVMEFGEDLGRGLGEGSVSSTSLPDMALADDEFGGYPGLDPRRRGMSKDGGMVGIDDHGGDDNGEGDDAEARGEQGRNRGEAEKREGKKKKLIFLTEKDATCEGRFLENLAAKENPSDMVSGQEVMDTTSTPRETTPRSSRGGKKKLRSQTAPATFAKGSPTTSSTQGGVGSGGGEGGPGASPQRTRSTTKGHGWEPLTLTALSEHRPAVQLLGGGDFAQGREFMWKPILSSSTKGS